MLCLFATVGCGYQDARKAYDDSADERTAAHRALRTEATELSVPRLGTPRTTARAICSAEAQRQVFVSETVSCTATHSVAFRVGDADASPDVLWAAEKSAMNDVVDDLDRTGWDRTEWGTQLDQSLADRNYDPYPVYNTTEAKDPVHVRLYLIDRRSHRPGELYEEAQPFAATLADSESGALVVVVFSKTYLVADCDECAYNEPTQYPSH